MINKTLTTAHPVTDEKTNFVTEWFAIAEYENGGFRQYWNWTQPIAVPTKPPLDYTKSEILGFFPAELDLVFNQARVTNLASYYSNEGDQNFNVNDLPD